MNETSIIDLSAFAGDIPDMEPDPEGTEAVVRVTGVHSGTTQNGDPYGMLFCELPNSPNAPEFSIFLGYPTEEMAAKKRNRCILDLQGAGQALGIDFFAAGGFDLSDAVGLEATAILGIGSDKEDKPCNTVKQWVTGH